MHYRIFWVKNTLLCQYGDTRLEFRQIATLDLKITDPQKSHYVWTQPIFSKLLGDYQH